MVFKRRRRMPPPGLRPELAAEERVVAWAPVPPGVVVVVTNFGVFLPDAGDRLSWHEIHKAVWDGSELVFTPAEVTERRDGYAVVADAPPRSVSLPAPGKVPDEVRTRVTRSVSFSSQQPVPGGAVLVAARRVPGVDGLSWTVRYEQGADAQAPGVREATDQLVAGLAAAAHDPSM